MPEGTSCGSTKRSSIAWPRTITPPIEVFARRVLDCLVTPRGNHKFDGRLILQARSQAALSLIAAEATSCRDIRGVLRVNEPISRANGLEALERLNLQTLLDGGTMVVTIEPDQGERYQSLVPIESSSLAGCLEFYFGQSDQLGTFLFLHCNGREAFGFLLQQLPPQLENDAAKRANQWEHWSRWHKPLHPKRSMNSACSTF